MKTANKKLIGWAVAGLTLLISFSQLIGDMDTVSACSLIPTPTGFVPSPTPPLHERVADATQGADVIVEGKVLDSWFNDAQEIIVIEVKQYLKGDGTEIIRLQRYGSPCLYPSFEDGAEGVFFAQGVYVDNTPFRYLKHFELDDTVVNQVTNTVGSEPFISIRSPSLGLMVGLFAAGALLLTALSALLFRRKRLSRHVQNS